MIEDEISRILNSDLADIDKTISHKINSIEQITVHLDEKTNFLAQFQLMLQKQLTTLKPNQILGCGIIKQQDINIQQQTKKGFVKAAAEDCQFTQSKGSTLIKSKFKVDQNKMKGSHFKQLHDFAGQIKHIYSKILQIKDEIKLIKQQVLQIISLNQIRIIDITRQQFKKMSTYFEQNKSKQLQPIQQINHQLNQKISELIQQNIYLSHQLQRIKNKQQNPRYHSSIQAISSITPKLFDQNTILQKKIDTSRTVSTSRQKINHQDSSFKSTYYKYSNINSDTPFTVPQVLNCQQNLLPNINILYVGIPPVKNGFGVLKTGHQIIYRGMWKNGKFEGKGKLVWQSYCYEGDFVKGYFQGYGRLQIQSKKVFQGQFIRQKAQGQGTLQQNGVEIIGVWKQNRLVRQY